MCWQRRLGASLGCHLFITEKVNLTVPRLAKETKTKQRPSFCLSVRLSSRDSHFSPRPCPSCPHQDPWPFISADSSNSCGHTKQAAAVTSCSCCGPFVLGGILRPCRLKLIPSFLLNQTAVVCAVWLQQELPECFLLGCRRGLRHLKASRTYLCRRVVI